MHRLKRFVPFAALALVSAFAGTPAAQAVGYCSATYCAGQPATKLCGCPPHTDRPGATATCGSWNRVGTCWYEALSASTMSASPSQEEFLASLADGQTAAPAAR